MAFCMYCGKELPASGTCSCQATAATEPVVVDLAGDNAKGNGQDKCPKCGATDIGSNPKTGKLRCNMCRNEFDPVKLTNDFAPVEGTKLSAGMADIAADSSDFLTLKCTSCGAEVMINTAESNSARCHWCRNKLNVNAVLPNGATPDGILPFKVPKQEAQKSIAGFLKKRSFFADKKFKKEYTLDNIIGVYFPYSIVDVSMHSGFAGEGEILKRKYTVTVGSGKNRHSETRYDADAYKLSRAFDLEIDDLAIETNADTKKTQASYGKGKLPAKTNNIINAILPFDTENMVQFDANYMAGYNSEKRDLNLADIEQEIEAKSRDIARNAAISTNTQYNRGVHWNSQEHQIKGKNLMAAYCPVWLYSYLNQKSNTIHYFAVNARTGETAGNVPLNHPLLIGLSAFMAVFLQLLDFLDGEFDLPLFLGGLLFYFLIRSYYTQEDNRDFYEKETKYQISNLVKHDEFFQHRKGLSNSVIHGKNDDKVEGAFGAGAKKKSTLKNIVDKL